MWCKEFKTIPYRSAASSFYRQVAGPFCSKKCSGQYGAAVQNGFKPYPPPDLAPPILKYKRKNFPNGRITDYKHLW